MTPVSLGLIVVPSPGTPVGIDINFAAVTGWYPGPQATIVAGATHLNIAVDGGIAQDIVLTPGTWPISQIASQINAATTTGVGTAVVTSGHAGLSYAVNDTGLITTGAGNAVYKVLTIGVGGAVSTVSITIVGSGYAISGGNATSVSTGGGNGALQIDILSLASISGLTASANSRGCLTIASNSNTATSSIVLNAIANSAYTSLGLAVGSYTDQDHACCKIELHPIATNTGKIYVGASPTFNSTSGLGMIDILVRPQTTYVDRFCVTSHQNANTLHTQHYFVDAENAGEGVVGVIWIE